MSSATLRKTATRSTCVANLCLSILAAAALHGEEPGEAEHEEDERTDGHGYGEVQIEVHGALAKIAKSSELCNLCTKNMQHYPIRSDLCRPSMFLRSQF